MDYGKRPPVAPAVHGAAQHTDITREIFLPANEGFVDAGTPADEHGCSVVKGAANGDEPSIFLTMKVPVDFVSFTSVKAIWACSAAAGNMFWVLIASYAACGEASDTHEESPAPGVTATGGFGIINCQEPANALTLASLALGDILGLGFHREGSDVSDTLDLDMSFYGLLFTYVANQ